MDLGRAAAELSEGRRHGEVQFGAITPQKDVHVGQCVVIFTGIPCPRPRFGRVRDLLPHKNRTSSKNGHLKRGLGGPGTHGGHGGRSETWRSHL